jgi:hypothetical protein
VQKREGKGEEANNNSKKVLKQLLEMPFIRLLIKVCTKIVVVTMIVTDGCGCDDDSDRWWWL